jgi:hypothetical protein
MERLAELISKLKEQFDLKADSSKLMGITLLIERELMKLESAQKQQQPQQQQQQPAARNSKISVVMPASRSGYQETMVEDAPDVSVQQPVRASSQPQYPERPKTNDYQPNPVQRQYEPAPQQQPEPEPQPELQSQPQPQPQAQAPPQPQSPVQPQPQVPPQLKESQQRAHQPDFDFNPLTEIPTLSQQHTAKEINELLGIRNASLNDKLKEDKVEIGHVVGEHPIKDLKKAIGVNDRYVFINELFRGDEVMYERSLKTINAFRIFAEAEYWIERELKVKLGWEEHKETTRHFYQLIKRRFS